MGARREFLLIDGYNIIFAWDNLKAIAENSLENARTKLTEIMSNYGGTTNAEIIIVFDAHKVKKGMGMVQKNGNIKVVYTKEGETADNYIEKTVANIGRKYKVRVATSDYLEQVIIMGHGAQRISAKELYYEVENCKKVIKEKFLNNKPIKNNMLIDNLDSRTVELLEQMRRQKGNDISDR